MFSKKPPVTLAEKLSSADNAFYVHSKEEEKQLVIIERFAVERCIAAVDDIKKSAEDAKEQADARAYAEATLRLLLVHMQKLSLLRSNG